MTLAVLLISFIINILIINGHEMLPPPCTDDIYCYGQLLNTVQMASVFPDSKTFVDMKIRYNRTYTLNYFNDLMNKSNFNPTREEIIDFIDNSFEPAGSEFEHWIPSDWVEDPDFLKNVRDMSFRNWASRLNSLWKYLGRKMKTDVKIHNDLYSIIYVPNPVIVPGGRFREFYYWDSYWIIRGLLLSEMHLTVKGMLGNFVSIVNELGFIPNGGRVYYTRRSQPPLFIPMFKSYIETTKDWKFLNENIGTLDKEFQFWMNNHTVSVEKNGKRYLLARYFDSSSGPRPESYREDIMSAINLKTQHEKDEYYSQLKTAAESGWDFSSRWFILNGTNKGNLTNVKTKYIIPVELNAIIYWNANILSDFYTYLGMYRKAKEYRTIAADWLEAVTEILWHDDVGSWLDYDLLNGKRRNYFYPSNISPLWTNCYNKSMSDYYVSNIMKYIEKSQVLVNLGGIPTTFEHTGEQWDFPNAWPPLQYIFIVSLDNTDDIWAKRLAFELTERWVRSNYKAYNESHAMYEKYDATVIGGHGGGGEYETQLGFGWTNGVIMELLNKYGDRLSLVDPFGTGQVEPQIQFSGAVSAHVSLSTQIVTLTLAFLATLSAGCIGIIVYSRRNHPYKINAKHRYSKLYQHTDSRDASPAS